MTEPTPEQVRQSKSSDLQGEYQFQVRPEIARWNTELIGCDLTRAKTSEAGVERGK
jgi:uncharacterized protein YdiU (UPF0061 family)